MLGIDLRTVRLPRLLLMRATDSDLRVWAAFLSSATDGWTLPDVERLQDILSAVSVAMLRELARRAGADEPEGCDGLQPDLGDHGSLLDRRTRQRLHWLLVQGPESPGLLEALPLDHPVRLMLEGVCSEAARRWSDGVDYQRTADAWIANALGEQA